MADLFAQLLLTLICVVGLGFALSILFRRLHQPPVIAETVAGILLGPSFLGLISPHLGSLILPASISPALGLLSQLGIVLYMFQVGLELDLGHLKGSLASVLFVSQASVVLPFLVGLALAYALLGADIGPNASEIGYCLFVAVAMSVTAFPVLARILKDESWEHSFLGRFALSCAALNDVMAWCLLAVAVAVAKADSSQIIWTLLGTMIYLVVMLLLFRPYLVRLAKNDGKANLGRAKTSLVFIILLGSSLATEAVGLHAIFGAFFLGALIPHDSSLAKEFEGRLPVVSTLFLPAFFAYTGMKLQIGSLGASDWGLFGLIVFAASFAKIAGTLLSARLTGHGWKKSSALGLLMNTRGMVELIVLNLGLELNLISVRLFTMLVGMALLTTMATTPLLRRFGSEIWEGSK